MADETGEAAPAEGAKKSGGIAALLPKLMLPLIAVGSMAIGGGVVYFLVGKGTPPPVEAKADEEGGDHAKDEEHGKDEHGKDEHGKKEEHAKAKEGKADSKYEEEAPAKEESEAKPLPDEEEVVVPEKEAGHEEKADAEHAGGEGGEGGEVVDARLIKFDPVVVNIFEKNSIHYLKIQIEVYVDKEEVIPEITANKSRFRDRMLFIFSDTSLREALSTGGKALLKEDIKAAFNRILTKGKIVNVYFTDFTVQ